LGRAAYQQYRRCRQRSTAKQDAAVLGQVDQNHTACARSSLTSSPAYQGFPILRLWVNLITLFIEHLDLPPKTNPGRMRELVKKEIQILIEVWGKRYNRVRLYSFLNYRLPALETVFCQLSQFPQISLPFNTFAIFENTTH
jgi:hypothetical protein